VEQISEHIFAPNAGYCVSYPSNIFRNTRSFENWGISEAATQVLDELRMNFTSGVFE